MSDSECLFYCSKCNQVHKREQTPKPPVKEPECEHEWGKIFKETYSFDRCFKCGAINKIEPLEKPAKKDCKDSCKVEGREIVRDELMERLYKILPSHLEWCHTASKVVSDEARKWAVECVEDWRAHWGFKKTPNENVDELISRLRGN